MKIVILILVACLTFCLPGAAYTLSSDVKNCLNKKFKKVEFKIDNSFAVKDEIYIPLIPAKFNSLKKIEIAGVIEDKNQKDFPKLIQLSNGLIFVKLLKQLSDKSTIIGFSEVPENIKKSLLNTKFPNDLVVPKNFFIEDELASIASELPVEISNAHTANPQTVENLNDLLYLTSPDTGKIIFLDSQDLSMIYDIPTSGIPWDITFDMNNSFLYVSDSGKNLIYKLEKAKPQIVSTFSLQEMTGPVDIELSDDGSLLYILGGTANEFVVYKTEDFKVLLKTKLPLNPVKFHLIKDLNLIAITSPNSNTVGFLNANNFSFLKQIKLESNPEKVIFNPRNKLIYISKRNGSSIAIIDPISFKQIGEIKVDETPIALAVDSKGKILYVACAKANTINIIDTDSMQVIGTIQLPLETQFPGDIEITSNDAWLIVTSETTNTISFIDLHNTQIVKKIDVGVTTHEAYIIQK